MRMISSKYIFVGSKNGPVYIEFIHYIQNENMNNI